MKGQQLYLKVHPYLWEFYRSFYGSEVINVKEHPLLSIRIKNILQTETQTWHHHQWSDFRIIVLNLPYFRTGNKAINITYRKFLDDRRQFLISQELYADFKNALHNFTLAYVLAGGSQADGIRDFCTFYNLEMNQVKTDSLKKSRDRSKLKEKWNKERKKLKKVKTMGNYVDNLSPGLIQ